MKVFKRLIFWMLGSAISLLILFSVAVYAAFSMFDTKKTSYVSNSVLEISLNQIIKDYVPKNLEQFDQILDSENQNLGLNRILSAIAKAQVDPKIVGISLQTNNINTGLASTKAIRDQLKKFKETGKFVYAYADAYDQKSYYLNSVADSIFLNPMGKVDFRGISAEVLFLKDFQQKSGVKVEVVRHGDYKSAVEPFLNNKMSEATKDQFGVFFNSIWNQMLYEMSESRSISTEKMNEIADKLWGRNAELAKKYELIEDVIYLDTYQKKLALATENEEGEYHKIKLKNYLLTSNQILIEGSNSKIAVIYAQGDIIYGKGDEENIGQELLIGALKTARENPSTKAIVLRINSPGGSALASELILREIILTKSKIPLVVSMGDYAASGGYYLACAADAIFAQPTTTTGSIGVFGLLINLHEIAERFGINSEVVSTHRGAKYSTFKPMTENYRALIQEDIEKVYNTFVGHVATHRNLTKKEVDQIAEGRIWTGVQAHELGLVDQIGNLNDAIAHAASLASVEEYELWNLPDYKIKFKDRITNILLSEAQLDFSLSFLNSQYFSLVKKLYKLRNAQGVQARIPFLFEMN